MMDIDCLQPDDERQEGQMKNKEYFIFSKDRLTSWLQYTVELMQIQANILKCDLNEN